MNNQQRAENAIKWIETLLKTRMRQGAGRLGNSRNGYCCLGVACKTLGLEYMPEAEFLSAGQANSIGLLDKEGEPRYQCTEENIIPLPDLNDSGAWDFKSIGGLLVDHPDQYFRPDVAKLIKKHFQES